MITHTAIMTINPTNGRLRGMLACNVFDGDSIDGLSNYIEELSWFKKLLYQLVYFKSFNGMATIFADGTNYLILEEQLKKHGLVFYRSKYDHDYYEYKVLMSDFDIVVLKLST
jgi:hypothetical protein